MKPCLSVTGKLFVGFSSGVGNGQGKVRLLGSFEKVHRMVDGSRSIHSASPPSLGFPRAGCVMNTNIPPCR